MAGLTGLAPVQNLYSSYPEFTVAGQTGEGALWSQGQPLDPQQLAISARNRNITPGFDQTEYPAPYDFEDDGFDTTLPGTVTNPDQTPRTHAGPFAGWAPNYNGDHIAVVQENNAQIHSEDFGALTRRTNSSKSTIAQNNVDIWTNEEQGTNNLQPLSGQVRRNAGFDATQGYGGGGKGPGGINTNVRSNGTFIRFSDPQPTYSLDPAERPFVVPQGGINAEFTDAVVGPDSTYGWSYADGASPYTDPSAYEPPAQPNNFTGQYTEGPIGG